MSSDRPAYSWTSTSMNGSTRAPSRDVVLRTPFATARTRPWPRVSNVTMRSASPSFWVRSTTASSRYRLTVRFSRATATAVARNRGESASAGANRPVGGGEHRLQRGPDDVGVDSDAPEHPAGDLALDVGRRRRVPAGAHRVLVVVEHPDSHPERAQGVDEGRDRPVPLALQGLRPAI